jgi:RNA polymerase sigma-70 factor (ECF subfamily)
VNAPADISDYVLTSAAAQGDEQAFAVLMRRHKSWLYRFIRRYTGDSDEACDLLQDTFVSAWQALARFDPQRSFPVWLRRIALNKCRDRARRLAVKRAALALFGFDAANKQYVPSADELAGSEQALRRLDQAIANLPRRLKEPLILTTFQGLSHKEAAATLGINAKAVEMRVYRARRRLAAELQRDDIQEIAATA